MKMECLDFDKSLIIEKGKIENDFDNLAFQQCLEDRHAKNCLLKSQDLSRFCDFLILRISKTLHFFKIRYYDYLSVPDYYKILYFLRVTRRGL